MNKISFALKNPKAENTAIILLHTCYDGRLKYYTGEKANPKKWPAVDDATDAQLSKIKNTVRELITDHKYKSQPLTKAIIVSSLDKLLHKKKVVSYDLFEAMTEVVDKMRSGNILTPQKKKYSKGSIKTFDFTIRVLKSFDPYMQMNGITLDTYRKFIVWCQSKDYSVNYTGAQIKNWKTLGRLVGGNPVFTNPEFKKLREETFDIYLDEKELAAIMKLNLRNREAVTRDWFILDCYTGLRVSDLVLLDKHNYQDGYITIANKKTDAKVVIPIHPTVKKILTVHKGFPPPITDVEINRTIKGVAKQAGITGQVLYTITKGGRRKDEYMEKWQMVSNHTARRSFITNLRKSGVPDTIVMKLTGIKSAATLQRYDKLSADEAAKIAAKLKFFK